ncbi:MAG TPA: Wzz/FepE/Etk N-terminal domain-containing protein [Blastocatellia bacterium]|nr:Wzz/FepE/Etk N-terminal domain-containing protein [Blastocatellia bacterium]
MAEEISLNPYIHAVWRAKWLIILAAVVAGAGVGYYRYRQPAVYTAQALLQIGRVWKEPIEDPYLTAELINSPSFLHQIAPKLGSKPGLIRRSIHAAAVTAGPQRSSYPILVSITATGTTSTDAAAFAKVTAEEVIARHDLAYDASMRPHLDYRKQLESMLAPTGALAAADKKADVQQNGGAATQAPGPVVAAGTPPLSDALAKTLHDYDEVRSNNESPAITQRTQLIADVAPGAYSHVSVVNPALIAALLAALIVCAAAIAVGALAAAPAPQQADQTIPNRREFTDAAIS